VIALTLTTTTTATTTTITTTRIQGRGRPLHAICFKDPKTIIIFLKNQTYGLISLKPILKAYLLQPLQILL